MAVYTVRAISLTGTTKTLTHEAVSERDLEQQLEAEGLSIARIVHVSSPDEAIRGRLRMSNADLCDFSDRLRILYAAGIPIVDCFAELEQGAASTSQRSVARYLKHGVQHGRGVSELMGEMPSAFPKTYVAAIRAAEKSGALDSVLLRVGEQMEWQRASKAVVLQALIYPAILLLAISTLIFFLFTFLLPKIAEFFTQQQVDLPWSTRVVLGISDFLRDNGVWIAASFAVTVILISVTRRFDRGHAAVDRAILRIPLIGPILRKVACSRFASTLQMLHASGTPMVEALESSREASGNHAIATDLRKVVDHVANGEPLTEALRETREFEGIVIRMVAVGEASGSLSQALEHTTRLLDRDVQQRTKRMLALLEPMMLIGSGLVVGFVIFATLMPLFQMLGNIH